jgi:hypothetical protein
VKFPKSIVLLVAFSTIGAAVGCHTGSHCDDGCCDPYAGSCQVPSLGPAYHPGSVPHHGHEATPPEMTPGPDGGGTPAPMPEAYDDAPSVPAPSSPTDAAVLPRF